MTNYLDVEIEKDEEGKPKCARCRDTWFMTKGKPLCKDCLRWFNSLSAAMQERDRASWGARTDHKRKPKAPTPEKSALEKFGFTPVSEIILP